MKKCLGCGMEGEEGVDFNRKKRRRDGTMSYQPRCKECQRKQSRVSEDRRVLERSRPGRGEADTFLDVGPFRRYLVEREEQLRAQIARERWNRDRKMIVEDGRRALALDVGLNARQVYRYENESQTVPLRIVDAALLHRSLRPEDLYPELDRHDDRPLLLGEAPGKAAIQVGQRKLVGPPLSGPIAKRICGYVGIRPEGDDKSSGEWAWYRALVARFDVDNLIPDFPGAAGSGKGKAFPPRLARAWARRKPLEGVVVILGRRVAAAYGLREEPWGRWTDVDGARATVVPHPSGVNVLMNEEEYRDLWRRVAEEATEGARE